MREKWRQFCEKFKDVRNKPSFFGYIRSNSGGGLLSGHFDADGRCTGLQREEFYRRA